jgi:benzoate membrane transport protein
MGTLGHSLSAALHDENEREASLITFIVTTSGISLLGIGSAFWGITFGLLAYYLRKRSLSAA